MNAPNKHLTPDEIAAVLGAGGGAAIPVEREQHLRSCEACERLLATHSKEQSRLDCIRGAPRKGPGPDCPPAVEWASLVGGLLKPERRDALLEHASACDSCGAMLRAVAQDFSRKIDDREAEEIEALRTSTREWQSGMARRMAAASRKPLPVPVWLAKAAAVILAVGLGWWAYLFWTAGQPARLLAQAYAQQRPFEFRIPGARHGPVRIEKRGIGSSFARPQPLLEAEARIARELQTAPENTDWLALRARAEMLAWDAESAIATLTRGLDQRSDDPDLLAALGMAYALRAEADNRALDYGRAIEYLSRSLKAKPDSREAVFNLALVYERMFLYDSALEQWRRYLALDPSGPWADEARHRLSEIEQKKKAR
ncbi:MAG: hypothetical protein HY235_16360 [Acidobacteria bacterium]|nr:hypothetical protein [Acidobacteriota bacterium]